MAEELSVNWRAIPAVSGAFQMSWQLVPAARRGHFEVSHEMLFTFKVQLESSEFSFSFLYHKISLFKLQKRSSARYFSLLA